MPSKEPPLTPATERDEPYYIDPTCDGCDEPLVLYDEHVERGEPIWYDEWVCIECESIRLDVPPADIETLETIFDDEFASVDR